MAWEKKKVWVVTIYLADKDEEGEDINWSSPSEEYFADTYQEAEKMKQRFLAGEDECYGDLIEDVLISDDMEEREFWKSDKLDEMMRRAGEIIRNKNLDGQQKDEKLAALMTELEGEYNIPLLKNPQWEDENPKLYKAYKAISDMREL